MKVLRRYVNKMTEEKKIKYTLLYGLIKGYGFSRAEAKNLISKSNVPRWAMENTDLFYHFDPKHWADKIIRSNKRKAMA